MERKINIVDEHLESIDSSRQPSTDDFFYTRLKAKMERGYDTAPLLMRPSWVVAGLTLLLALNIFMLSNRSANNSGADYGSSSQEKFEKDYGFTISTTY